MTEKARLLSARCNCCTTTDFQASPVNRRAFLSGSAALAAFGGMVAIDLMEPLENATAQSLAGRQIRLIVPFPAGGPTDIVARPFAQMLGDGLKSIVVIDNRGGAGGSLGADAVAKSAPDGRTLLMGTVGTHAINPALYKKLPYDAERDFTPIALVALAPVAIVVHPSQPVNNVAELVALAKRLPGKLNYGSAGAGTPGHLTGEMFKKATGIDIQHVAYRGSAPAVTDLIGGQLQIMFDPLQSVLSNIQGGKLRAIAVSSEVRSPALPNVPTIGESGYEGFETTAWWGVFAPAKLPANMAETLGNEIERIVRSDAFRGNLQPLGVLPTVLTGRAFAQFQARELVKWGEAVRDSGAAAG
jgi:tripartite-type tricarboxylate transporter receptor subunit TctC